MTEVEVNSFNQKFEQYLGGAVRGANVKALLSAIDNNNRANSDDESKKVTPNGVTNKAEVKTGSTYNVTVNSTTAGGLISAIDITENSK